MLWLTEIHRSASSIKCVTKLKMCTAEVFMLQGCDDEFILYDEDTGKTFSVDVSYLADNSDKIIGVFRLREEDLFLCPFSREAIRLAQHMDIVGFEDVKYKPQMMKWKVLSNTVRTIVHTTEHRLDQMNQNHDVPMYMIRGTTIINLVDFILNSGTNSEGKGILYQDPKCDYRYAIKIETSAGKAYFIVFETSKDFNLVAYCAQVAMLRG